MYFSTLIILFKLDNQISNSLQTTCKLHFSCRYCVSSTCEITSITASPATARVSAAVLCWSCTAVSPQSHERSFTCIQPRWRFAPPSEHHRCERYRANLCASNLAHRQHAPCATFGCFPLRGSHRRSATLLAVSVVLFSFANSTHLTEYTAFSSEFIVQRSESCSRVKRRAPHDAPVKCIHFRYYGRSALEYSVVWLSANFCYNVNVKFTATW